MRTNLILLVIATLLIATVMVEINHEKQQRPQPLTQIDTDSIEEVMVRCNDCATRRFAKQQGHWWMREPYILPADDNVVTRLLTITHAPVRFQHPASELDLKKLGLDPAQATLNFNEISMAIGTTDAIHGDRYVRIGTTVFLVLDRFSAFLHATPPSELDRHLAPLDSRLSTVIIDGIEHPSVAKAWQETRAKQIVISDANTIAPKDTINIQLNFANNERLSYALFRHGANYRARRLAPALEYILEETEVQALLGKNP